MAAAASQSRMPADRPGSSSAGEPPAARLPPWRRGSLPGAPPPRLLALVRPALLPLSQLRQAGGAWVDRQQAEAVAHPLFPSGRRQLRQQLDERALAEGAHPVVLLSCVRAG